MPASTTKLDPSNANSTDAWRAQIARLAAVRTPSFFHLRAQLPKQGRTNDVLAATPNMSVVLKTYATGGENGLHAHSNEDHVFVILQGEANFYGPQGEAKHVVKNDCVVLPRGSYYRFEAVEGAETLVLLRIGAVVNPKEDVMTRVDLDGLPFDGQAEKNHEVPLVLYEDRFFE
ncbi:MAG: cupin [Ramlibacter sp.]|nr:cupin [Ramlibacter sp.]